MGYTARYTNQSPTLKEDSPASESSVLINELELDSHIVSQVHDIFPLKSRLEVVDVVKDHKDKSVEEIVELVFELDAKANDFPLDVYKIHEMLPSASLDTISEVYYKQGENVENTLSRLMDPVGLDTDDASRLAKVLGVTLPTSSRYLERNDNDYTKAIIDLVLHEEADEETMTTRVQRTTLNNAYPRKKVDLAVLNELYEDSEELQKLCKSFLNNLFWLLEGDMVRILEVVGNIRSQGYEELSYIGNWNSGKEMPKLRTTKGTTATTTKTPKTPTTAPILQPVLGSVILDHPSIQLLDHQKTATSRSLVSSDKRVRGYYSEKLKVSGQKRAEVLNNPEIDRSVRTLGQFNITNRIDLHSYQVTTALQMVKQALNDWWKAELDERVKDGQLGKYGHKAQFVDPVELITGRGIHSAGGIAKIKPTVRRHLDQQRYLYEEESWGYIVRGKR